MKLLLAVALVLVVGFGASGFTTPAPEDPPTGFQPPDYRPSLDVAPFDKGVMDTDKCIARRDETRSVISRCIYGNPNSRRTVVLMGDSHALQYGPAMIRIAKQRGWRLIALIRQRCVAAIVKYEPICDSWRRDALRKIDRIRPDMVVVSTATIGGYRVTRNDRQLTRRQSEPFLTEGMTRTLRRFGRTGAKVTVIRDQIFAPFMPQDCLAEKPKEECSFPAIGRHARGPFDAKAARAVKGTKLIDPVPKLCPGGICPAVVNGIVVYRDDYHLTATYGETLTRWLNLRLPRLR